MQTQQKSQARDIVSFAARWTLQALQIALGVVYLAVQYRVPYKMKAFIANFERADVIIALLNIFSGPLGESYVGQSFVILAWIMSITLHYSSNEYVSLITSIAWFASGRVFSGLGSQHISVAGLTASITGTYYLYLSMGFNSKNKYAATVFGLAIAEQLAFTDFSASAVQLVFFLLINKTTYLHQTIMSFILLGYTATTTLRNYIQERKQKLEKLRRLQTHAVMNAYVTVRD